MATSSSTSPNRKLNSLETRLHQSALLSGRVSLPREVTLLYANCSCAKPLSQKEIDVLAPDPHARTNAINFLLAAVCGILIPYVFMLSALMQGLLKLMRDPNGNLSYRAVQKNELDACGMLFVSYILLLISATGKRG